MFDHRKIPTKISVGRESISRLARNEKKKKKEKKSPTNISARRLSSLQIRFLEGEIEKDRSPRCVVGANGFYRVRPYPGVFYLKPGTRKKQPWTRLRRVSRVKVGRVFVCVCVYMYACGGGRWRKEGDVGQFSRARSTYRQAARNNLAAIDATLLKIEPPSREGCNTTWQSTLALRRARANGDPPFSRTNAHPSVSNYVDI